MQDQKVHLSPDGMLKNPAFSQVVVTQGAGRTIYVGGQNAVTPDREIKGKNDIALQTRQVMENLGIALRASGATFDDLVKLTIYVVQGQDISKGFEASQEYLRHNSTQPIVTVLFVAGLIHPDILIEIDAIAFVPD